MPTRIWGLLVVAACGTSETSRPEKGSAAPAPQTAKAAMQIVCDAEATSDAAKASPADKARVMSEWMRTRVTNLEILRALEEVSLDTWPSAKTRLVALAKQHGAEPCALGAASTQPKLGVAVPEAQGLVEPDTDAPLAVVTPTEITYEGNAIVTLENGALAPAEVKNGVVTKLANAVAAKPMPEVERSSGSGRTVPEVERASGSGRTVPEVERASGSGRTVTGRARIAFDRSIPMATATAVIAAFATGDVAKVALVVEQNDVNMLLPLDMPLKKPFEGTLVVGATKDQLVLWSTSGKFGTLKTPYTTAPLDGGLGQIVRSLAEIKAKHGGSGVVMLPSVVVMLDASHDVARLTQILGSIRTMFPSVMLSVGFR